MRAVTRAGCDARGRLALLTPRVLGASAGVIVSWSSMLPYSRAGRPGSRCIARRQGVATRDLYRLLDRDAALAVITLRYFSSYLYGDSARFRVVVGSHIA